MELDRIIRLFIYYWLKILRVIVQHMQRLYNLILNCTFQRMGQVGIYRFLVVIFGISIILHLHQCQEKALKCKVDGCGRLMRSKDMEEHAKEAAASYYSLQSEEVQRLRRLMFEQVKTMDQLTIT